MKKHTTSPFTRTINQLLIGLCATLMIGSSMAQGPRPPEQDLPITAAERQALIDAVIQKMEQGYVFPEQAAKVAKAMRQRQKAKQYDGVTSSAQLATLLTTHLHEESRDKHLRVDYSFRPIPPQVKGQKPTAEQQAEELEDMKRGNFGLERVERLPWNIGYLDLRVFAPVKHAGTTLAAGMTVLANTNALIIDLRKNGGGDPNTVAFIASYLLDESTQLNDIYQRETNLTQQNWTTEYVNGLRFGQKKDVYILTSKHTFSAAEDFSYAMKNLKRATIIGEATGGGAHPGEFARLAEHFVMFVPGGRSISPITHTDWEGVGVIPDVAVPASEAFKAAQLAILNKRLQNEKQPRTQERLKQRIAEVEQEPNTKM